MNAEARHIYEQYIEQVKVKSCPDILDRNFPHQERFINDPARLKAAFCTRRAAKSYTGGLYLMKEALRKPGVSCLYIALTRDSAKKIMWKDILKTIDAKFKLGCTFNETLLTCTLPNGSVIYLTGVDTDEDEKKKLLGQKYLLVVCDEASMYSIDLRELIYGILKPAVADYRGTICLLGTSGNLTQGLFFDITKSDGTAREPGWALHEWTAFENPYIKTQWAEELRDIETTRPLFKNTPLYKQWYLNQWVIDTNKLCYWYLDGRNEYGLLPRYTHGEWNFVLGVDLGYRPDPSAFTVGAFHENDKTLYVLESFKQLEMDITDVANRIKSYQAKYPIFKVVIDGANKQAVEEIQKRHEISLEAANKTGKSDFIEIMNAEFVQGLIKVQPATNKDLIDEWKRLVWCTEGDKIVIPRTEHPGLANHHCDATQYMWRFCYQFLSESRKEPVRLKDKNAFVKHTEKLMEEKLEAQIQHEQAEERGEDIWAISELDNEKDILSYYLNKRGKGR